MEKYSDFINQIPEEVMQNTQRYLCKNIALFKPKTYMEQVTIHSSDYHIMIPSERPPDIYFNNRLTILDKKKILTVNPGDVVLCTKAVAAKPYFSFLIKNDLLHKVAEEMGFYGEIKFSNILNPFSSDLIQVVKNFDNEVTHPNNLKLMLDCLEIQIAVLLLREFKTNLKKFVSNSPESNSYINLAMEYIQTYFSSNITIEDICTEINVSPFHFIRMFKKKVGVSPHQYLLNVRIEKAKELLGKRRYSLAETAALCGFVSVSHFSARFKEKTGYSPGVYKKQ